MELLEESYEVVIKRKTTRSYHKTERVYRSKETGEILTYSQYSHMESGSYTETREETGEQDIVTKEDVVFTQQFPTLDMKQVVVGLNLPQVTVRNGYSMPTENDIHPGGVTRIAGIL